MSVVQMFKASLPPIKTRFESPSNSQSSSVLHELRNSPLIKRISEEFDCKIGQLHLHAIVYARAHKITVYEAIQYLSKIMN